jgi:hypothetical protein
MIVPNAVPRWKVVSTLMLMQSAFEKAGIRFIDNDYRSRGSGARFAERTRATANSRGHLSSQSLQVFS